MTCYMTSPECHAKLIEVPATAERLAERLPCVIQCGLCGVTDTLPKGTTTATGWKCDTGVVAAAVDEFDVDVCPNCQRRTREAITALRKSARRKAAAKAVEAQA